jgi:DNA (cytosine-5)-methyltransferase 1
MRYGSVCSGIEAATVAWHPLGWEPAFFSEIEPAPRSVLAHHYPDVPCHGDFTTIGADQYGSIDLLVGGTPCQSFSVAGLRGGLDDDRGNLALEFLRLAQRTRPKWLVWENVPGVLSSNGGRDFGSILGGLVECGYGFAYRVLDAQYFGVAQRRRRVFVVGCLGDTASAAAVLFERHSLQGHSAPSRQKGKEVAGTIAARFGRSRNNHEELAPTLLARNGASGGFDLDREAAIIDDWPAQIAPTLNAHFGDKMGLENQHINGGAGLFVVAKCLTARGASGGTLDPENANFVSCQIHGTAKPNEDLICFEANMSQQSPQVGQLYPTLTRRTYAAIAFPINTQLGLRGADTSNSSREGLGLGNEGDPSFTLQAAHSHAVATQSAVRRLTPRECERLQGFPDDYTLVPHRNKPMSDGPRYKALGNSMAVPVMHWIGKRIQMVEDMSA